MGRHRGMAALFDGGAIALAGLVTAEQPVPVRIRKWRERIIVEERGDERVAEGAIVEVSFDPRRAMIFENGTGRRLR